MDPLSSTEIILSSFFIFPVNKWIWDQLECVFIISLYIFLFQMINNITCLFSDIFDIINFKLPY